MGSPFDKTWKTFVRTCPNPTLAHSQAQFCKVLDLLYKVLEFSQGSWEKGKGKAAAKREKGKPFRDKRERGKNSRGKMEKGK